MGFSKTILGRTNLHVSRLGIGSSYGTDAAMIEEAFEKGVNYFYWGALRTRRMAEGIRNIAKNKREEIVIVAHSNAQFAFQLPSIVHKSLKQLNIDYIDILLLGGRNKRPSEKILEKARQLKEQGLFNWLAVSGHNRLVFPEFEKKKLFDIFHVRYNAAHRGAEREIFEQIPENDGPGIVSFTNTRWGGLLNPKNMPEGEKPPHPADCYRFVLSHPKVHVAICGPNSRDQLKEDLKAIEKGPMSQEELAHMQKIGDYVYTNVSMIKDNLKGMASIKWRRNK